MYIYIHISIDIYTYLGHELIPSSDKREAEGLLSTKILFRSLLGDESDWDDDDVEAAMKEDREKTEGNIREKTREREKKNWRYWMRLSRRK